MIESLPDVSHLRYRGERVEWQQEDSKREWRLLPVSALPSYYIGVIHTAEGGGYIGGAFSSAEDFDTFGSPIEDPDAGEVARRVVESLLAHSVVTSVNGHEMGDTADGADDGHAFVLSPELLALASAVAQRQGQSLDDLLTRIVTTKVVSIAVVDYRDDPEIRRLHINLAESWGKE